MNKPYPTYQELIEKYGQSPTGIQVHNFETNYAQEYKLNGPYMIVREQFDFTAGKVSFRLIAPGFHKEEIASLNLVNPNDRPMHMHSYFELMAVTSGSVTQKIEGKDYIYPAGSCCLLNHNVRHLEISSVDTTLWFLELSDPFFLETINADTRFDENGCIVSQKNDIYEFMQNDFKQKLSQKQYWDFTPLCNHAMSCETLEYLFATLLEETQCRKPGFVLMVQCLITRLFSHLLDKTAYDCQKHLLPCNQEEYLFLRVQDILMETNGRASREQLSTRLHYSADYLNRIVVHYTGMSLKKYGRVFTLKEAARLLSQTDLKISEIMNRLNLSNRSYFYGIFEEQYGVTPSEYRKA